MLRLWAFMPPLSLPTRKLILIITSTLLLTLSFSSRAAVQVTLAWDKADSTEVEGYVLYYGESSGDYTQNIDVGNEAIYTIDGLERGKTYFFAAKSYDQDHSKFSELSTEIKATIPYEEASSQSNVESSASFDKASSQVSVSAAQPHNDKDEGKLSQQLPVVELGEIKIDNTWTRITFSESFFDPIVIAKPLSYNETDPAIIDIRNVSPTGFEARAQEWSHLDGNHALEKVGYLAIEKGAYTLPDGTRLEASQGEAGGGFAEIPFLQEYQKTPVVIASIYSDNNGIPLVSRLKDITTEGFQVFFQAGESQNINELSSNETFSYIAWEPSSGITNGVAFEVNRTPNAVGHSFYSINYQQSFVELPIFLADIQTANNEAATNLRWRNKELLSVEIKTDEERSHDANEAGQATESVGYALFGIASDN